MCQFTLQEYISCGHTRLLNGAINTTFCLPVQKALHRSNIKGLDEAPACCHPLPVPRDNGIATVHKFFGLCEDCQPQHINKIQEICAVKADLVLSRQALREELDFETYGQDDVEEIARLRNWIRENIEEARNLANNFEVSMKLDTTRLDLHLTLRQPGDQKYDTLFLQVLRDCHTSLNVLGEYMQQCVPRRMFEDMVRFIYKKTARAAERAGWLDSIGAWILEDEGSGDHKEVIASLTGKIMESMFLERMGTSPAPSLEHFGYLDDPQEQPAQMISAREKETKRLEEIETFTSEWVPAKRNDAGSILYEFPMRQRDLSARLTMSTAKFANQKLPDIIKQRDLKCVVTNELLPRYKAPEEERPEQQVRPDEQVNFTYSDPIQGEAPTDADGSASDDEKPTSADANGLKLPKADPAYDIWIKHRPFVDCDESEEVAAKGSNGVPREESAKVSSEDGNHSAPASSTEAIGRTFSCDFSDDDDDVDAEEETSNDLSNSLPDREVKTEEAKDTTSTATSSPDTTTAISGTENFTPPHTPASSPSSPSNRGPVRRKRSSIRDLPDDKSPPQKAQTSSHARSEEDMSPKQPLSTALDVNDIAESPTSTEVIASPYTPAQNATPSAQSSEDLTSASDNAVDTNAIAQPPASTEDLGLEPTPAQDAVRLPSVDASALNEGVIAEPLAQLSGAARLRAPFASSAATLGAIVRKRSSAEDLGGEESPARKRRASDEEE